MTNIHHKFFGLFLVSFLCYNLYAQDTIKKIVNEGDNIDLRLVWLSTSYGEIQWQKSLATADWQNIEGATTKDYLFNADSSALFRAQVTSGTCDPFYSRINKLTVFHLRGLLASVTENSAEITGTIDVENTPILEHGIVFDSVSSFNPVVSKIADSTKDLQSLHYTFQNLTPGKTYFASLYVITSSGTYILGNKISFSTIQANAINRVDYSDTSARFWYTLSGSVELEEHGVFLSDAGIPDSTSLKIQGIKDNTPSKVMDLTLGIDRWYADIKGLKPDSSYFVRPYLKTGDRYYSGNTIKIKPYSDYSSFPVNNDPFTISHKIVWNDPSTARKLSVSFGDYGRVKRIGNSDTLLLVYHGGPNPLDYLNIYLRKSYDNGDTWQKEEIIRNPADYPGQYYRFCNPELLYLKNGWLLLAYEANSAGDENNSTVQILTSKDRGQSWEGPVMIRTGRSWEPAMVQLPNGEIELFYSCEANWWPVVNGSAVYQEIAMIHSTNDGQTWSSPKTVAYYPYKRDGMPVPALLQGNKGVVFTIESVGSAYSPYIIYRPLKDPWTLTSSTFENNTYRWYAGDFGGHGGAPYIIQLPSGETVLSVHRYRGGDWHQNNDMKVMIGNNAAKSFSQLSTPYALPMGESAVNNSLFLKNNNTIVAISCRMFSDGTGGIYWLEGSIIPN